MKDMGYEKVCGTCVHFSTLYPYDRPYCDKKGPVDEMGKCGKYRFDIMKHKPSAPLAANDGWEQLDEVLQ